jgi:hypothetical protein
MREHFFGPSGLDRSFWRRYRLDNNFVSSPFLKDFYGRKDHGCSNGQPNPPFPGEGPGSYPT